MNNNKNKDTQLKLEREIWLFEQWLSGMAGQTGDTQERIRQAYKDCIIHRQLELAKLQTQDESPIDTDACTEQSETFVPEVSVCWQWHLGFLCYNRWQ